MMNDLLIVLVCILFIGIAVIKSGRKTQGLQPWDISPSLALAALDRALTRIYVLQYTHLSYISK